MQARGATRTRSLVQGVLLGLLALAGSTARSYGQEPLEVRIQQIDASQYPRVTAVLEAVDQRGLPIQGVSAERIRVFEHNVPIAQPSLVPVQQAGLGIGVVLAVDVSGSMAGEPLEAAKRAAGTFIDRLGEQDRVAILSFASLVRRVQDFTSNKEEAKQKLASLVAIGNTKLYEALYHGVELAGQSALPRKVVVLLTDGKDTDSVRPAKEGLNLALEKGVNVSTVGLGAVDRPLLEEFANVTGGISLFTSNPLQLGEAYSLLSTRLRSAYVLSYAAPRHLAPAERTLRVEVAQGNQLGKAERSFRVELPPFQLRLTGLGEVLSQETVLRVEVDRPEWVADVRFVVDGQESRAVAEPPFTLALSPRTFQGGSHTVEVVVRDVTGRENSQGLTFTLPGASPVQPASSGPPWWRLALEQAQQSPLALLALIALPTSLVALIAHLVDFWRGRPCFACGLRRPGRDPCRACQTRFYAQSQPLGQMLVRAGAITEEQLKRAIETTERRGKRLGEVLTGSQLIARQELRAALLIQERTTALALRFQRLLSESEGGLSFRAGLLIYSSAAVLSLLLLIAPLFASKV